MDNLLAVGEFAKLAGTTKRTIVWYDKIGILKPYKVDQTGYRYYMPQQILDYQAILLLQKLRFSLEEIKKYLDKGKNIQDMFLAKRQDIQNEMVQLQQAAQNLDLYYTNLDKNGTLIKPEEVLVEPFDIYYIEKTGSYIKIKDYIEELSACFVSLPKKPTFLTIFLEEGYKPKKSKMKIGIKAEKGLIVKISEKGQIQRETIHGYKALRYIHHGAGNLLSILWKELEKYADKNKYIWKHIRAPFVSIEYYKIDNIFEIHLPIERE